MHTQQVLLGARIPVSLKEKVSKYCLNHGIKLGYFVAQAIKEKLLEMAEENQDVRIANARLKKAEYFSQNEFNAYLSKRGIRS